LLPWPMLTKTAAWHVATALSTVRIENDISFEQFNTFTIVRLTVDIREDHNWRFSSQLQTDALQVTFGCRFHDQFSDLIFRLIRLHYFTTSKHQRCGVYLTYSCGTCKGYFLYAVMRCQSCSSGSSKAIHDINYARWESSLRNRTKDYYICISPNNEKQNLVILQQTTVPCKGQSTVFAQLVSWRWCIPQPEPDPISKRASKEESSILKQLSFHRLIQIQDKNV
jgi:hypothetical protein